jgi:hypothetical protein
LYALSQCQKLRRFYIRGPGSTINGLTYLTNLPQLTDLKIYYGLGECISTRFLLDFARSCPHLATISLTDYNTGTSLFEPPGLFFFDDVSELFDAAEEQRDYLELQYTTSNMMIEVLDQCQIRIDNLRRDKLADMTMENGIFTLVHRG